nr:MAG: hypothetical protein [Crogonang virus 45]
MKMKPKPTNRQRNRRKAVAPQPQSQTTRGLPNKLRSTNTITRSLGNKLAIGRRTTNAYLSCRMMPFSGEGRAALPDGSNTNFVVTDSFAIDNIAMTGAGSRSFIIQTMPTLPQLAMIGSTGGIVINGQTSGTLSSYAIGSVPGLTWTPICIPSIFNTSCVPGTPYADPWSASSMRFINIAFRIVYTGPVNTCSGSLTVTPNNCVFVDANATTREGLRLFPVNMAGTALSTPYPGGTPMLATDLQIASSAFTRASRTFRPEQGVTLIAPHTGSSFDNIAIGRTPYALISASQSTAAVTDINPALRQVTYNGVEYAGIACYDNGWGGFQIAFENINADASFRIESMVCMEVCPMVSSPYYPMSQRSSPPADKAVLDQAAKLVAEKGIAAAGE